MTQVAVTRGIAFAIRVTWGDGSKEDLTALLGWLEDRLRQETINGKRYEIRNCGSSCLELREVDSTT